jgi:hypothetical protein
VGVSKHCCRCGTPTPTPPRKGEGRNLIPIFGIKLDSHPNHWHNPRIPFHQKGRLAIVTKRGTGCGGRGSVVARFWRADERC